MLHFGARRAARTLGRAVACLLLLALPATAQTGAHEAPLSPQDLDEEGTAGGAEDHSQRLLFNGFGVAHYAYDDNTKDNSFLAGVLALAVYKPLGEHLSFFGQLNAEREGPPLLSEEKEGEEDAFEVGIDNLILNWRPAPSSGFDLTFGKFDSPLGIERDDAPLNFQATPSFTLSYARPVKFSGLQLHQAFSPHFEGWAILANGWNVDVDNNHAKTVALYGMWSPSLRGHVGLGVIHGAERDDDSNDARTTAVATLLFQPQESWVIGGESVAGREEAAAEDGKTAEWWAQTLFVHHRFAGRWAGTLRAEVFDDTGGSRTGERQVVRSLVLSPQYLVGGGFYGVFRYLPHTSLRLPQLAVRLDLRYDHSSEPVFATGAEEGETGRNDRFSATLQTVFVF